MLGEAARTLLDGLAETASDELGVPSRLLPKEDEMNLNALIMAVASLRSPSWCCSRNRRYLLERRSSN